MPSPGSPYVWIPMSDGTCLSVRLFLPDGDDRPWPVLLEALPYRKDDLTASYSSEYRRLRDEGRLRGRARRPARHGRVGRASRPTSTRPQEQADLRRGDRVARGRSRGRTARSACSARRTRASTRCSSRPSSRPGSRAIMRDLRVGRPLHRRRPLHGRHAPGRRPRRLRPLHDRDGARCRRRPRSPGTTWRDVWRRAGRPTPSRGCCAGSRSSGTAPYWRHGSLRQRDEPGRMDGLRPDPVRRR